MRLFPRRRFVNALTALSLLLSVAVVAVWARSVFYADVYSIATEQYDGEGKGYDYRLRFTRGGVLVALCHFRVPPSTICHASQTTTQRPLNVVPLSYDPIRTRLWRSGYRRWGYGIRYDEGPIPYSQQSFKLWDVHFPLYVPLILSSILPAALLVSARRSRRRVGHCPPHQCPQCGYDTRANPAKCSECGFEPAGDGAAV